MANIHFKKKTRVEQEIPTGPMADISFLLIIFFMVTTVFVVYRGFPVDLPAAQTVDILKGKRNVVSIWIGADGRMMVDEYDVTLS
jgi:biopolymer transport protein ExbD